MIKPWRKAVAANYWGGEKTAGSYFKKDLGKKEPEYLGQGRISEAEIRSEFYCESACVWESGERGDLGLLNDSQMRQKMCTGAVVMNHNVSWANWPNLVPVTINDLLCVSTEMMVIKMVITINSEQNQHNL